jgi:peptidoglycan hydrolase CwlO-like protein
MVYSKIERKKEMTDLEKMLQPYLRIPTTLDKLLKEIEKIMSKFNELQDKMDSMKQMIADEAGELRQKFEELESRIASGISAEEADQIMSEIDQSLANVEALSDS